MHSTKSLKNIGILIIGSLIKLNKTSADTAVLKSKVFPIPIYVEKVTGASKLGKKYTDPIMIATIIPLFLRSFISLPLLRNILPKKSSYQEYNLSIFMLLIDSVVTAILASLHDITTFSTLLYQSPTMALTTIALKKTPKPARKLTPKVLNATDIDRAKIRGNCTRLPS